ncbi:MAG: acyl-CoA dehydrogenase family protein, partial [Microbacterium gubbeenense]
MADTLDPRYDAIRAEARGIAQSLAPYAAEADELDVVHEPMREAVRASGLGRLVVPAAYGGESDVLDPLAIAI